MTGIGGRRPHLPLAAVEGEGQRALALDPVGVEETLALMPYAEQEQDDDQAEGEAQQP